MQYILGLCCTRYYLPHNIFSSISEIVELRVALLCTISFRDIDNWKFAVAVDDDVAITVGTNGFPGP